MRHNDFERIHHEFCTYYCKGITQACPKGDYEYYEWLKALNLDEALPYSQAYESFQWAKDQLRFYREDDTSKYYKVLVGFPIKSMNGNVYRENDLQTSARTLIGVHPNLNHKDHIFQNTQFIGAQYEDGAVEAILQVNKTEDCPICGSQKKLSELIDDKRIVNVSLEGACKNEGNTSGNCEGFQFTGCALLTTDVLPGIPMARIFPMESYVPPLRSSRYKRIKVIGMENKPKESKVQEPCSPELRKCVDDLIADGKPEDSAWAICKSRIGESTGSEMPGDIGKFPCASGYHWSGTQQTCIPDEPQPQHTTQPIQGTQVLVGTAAASDTSKQPQIQGESIASLKVDKLRLEREIKKLQHDAEEKAKDFTLEKDDLEAKLRSAYEEKNKITNQTEGQLQAKDKELSDTKKECATLRSASFQLQTLTDDLEKLRHERDHFKQQYEDLKKDNDNLNEKYRKTLETNLVLEKKLTETNEEYLTIAKEKDQTTEALRKAKNLAGKIRAVGLDNINSPKK